MNPSKRQEKLQACRNACAAGDAALAERLCQTLLRANKADVQALHILGVIAAARHDYAAATAHFGRCAAIDTRNALFHHDAARVHALSGRYGPAQASLERALQLQPDNQRARTDLADVLERSGQHDSARAVLAPLERADAAGMADDHLVLIQMRLLDHAGDTAQAIALGQRQLSKPPADVGIRQFVLQLLGRLHEKTGAHRDAFQAFADAKQLEAHAFVPEAYARAIDGLIEAFSAEALARLPRAAIRSDTPVFIACMPRSGSTLVEQVIHAHPQAFGAGETALLHDAIGALPAALGGGLPYPQCIAALAQADVDQLAGDYLKAIGGLAPGAARVTNKHLLNYLHLGIVSVLFPQARVIHIRRNRLDNGLACFMASLPPSLMPWASDLRHIGFAWRQYERLMDHWRRTLDIQLLEVAYEDLVHDTEAQVRRIIDFCGLPWDARCLRFWEAERVVLTPSYDQVRRPVFNTAVDRWRKYEALLGPLQDALA